MQLKTDKNPVYKFAEANREEKKSDFISSELAV
jgi:hypothetical protein